ncbi:hypothetical protein [Lacinutrix cladophorae]
MEIEKAIKIISEFKGNNLRHRLSELKNNLIINSEKNIDFEKEVYEAALIVKNISSQIDEIVHATGIINCLPKILLKNEIIEDLSLASGADGQGIDLVTNLRVAEFKFSQWQVNAANGMRKRQVFADCVNLFLLNTHKKKELYVIGAETIEKFFQSKRAKWRNVLSKSGGLDNRLDQYLISNNISGEFLNDIYSISGIEIFEINNILN